MIIMWVSLLLEVAVVDEQDAGQEHSFLIAWRERREDHKEIVRCGERLLDAAGPNLHSGASCYLLDLTHRRRLADVNDIKEDFLARTTGTATIQPTLTAAAFDAVERTFVPTHVHLKG